MAGREPIMHWRRQFHVLSLLSGFPCMTWAARETQFDAKYRHAGRNRRADSPHCLFKYTLHGEGAISIRDREYRTPVGSGFLCEVCDPDIVYYYPPDATEPWEFVWLSFVGETSFRMVRDLTARYGPVFRLPLWHGVIRRMLELERGAEAAELYLSEGAEPVMELLLALLHAQETSRPLSQDESIVRDALRVADARPGVTVKELARELGISREHLSRVFARCLLSTPQRYICRRRLLTACRLLKESRLDVADVARQSGYDDAASFARFFRREMRMSPGSFRRRGAMPAF